MGTLILSVDVALGMIPTNALVFQIIFEMYNFSGIV